MGKSEEKTSKSYTLRISENARQNFDDIIGYIAFVKHQPQNAIKVGEKIIKVFENIELNPHVFRECEEITTKTKIYRKAVCMSWLIIYKVQETEILILGIIHGSRSASSIGKLKSHK